MYIAMFRTYLFNWSLGSGGIAVFGANGADNKIWFNDTADSSKFVRQKLT